MMPVDALAEFRTHWLANATRAGIVRIIDLLEHQSPLLVRTAFSREPGVGCLATHLAWNHPITCNEDEYAGQFWLCHVANLNPATSRVIQAWDESGDTWELRMELLAACHVELASRIVEKSDASYPKESDFDSSMYGLHCTLS